MNSVPWLPACGLISYAPEEVTDILARLDIATGALVRIFELIENTGPWNAELGLQQIRGIVMNAEGMITSQVMYEERP